MRGALRGGELVEGAGGGEEPVGEAGGDEGVVVDEVEETPLARRPRRGLGGFDFRPSTSWTNGR